ALCARVTLGVLIDMDGNQLRIGESQLSLPPDSYFRPLHPEARDQGDPYILTAPPSANSAHRFYVYTSGQDDASGKAFPIYGSDDLLHWQSLGGALVADLARAHWAPCIQYIPSLDYPYVMLYSRGQGHDERAHVGHALRRAHSRSPAGPFVDSGHILTAGLDFAIDPDIYRLPDGQLKIAFAADFVEDQPLGTGLVEASINEHLTQLVGPTRTLARAKYDWQVYDASRRMPWKQIPGVDWEKDRVRWNTLEGPVGGLLSPQGRSVYLYSGGCFFLFYGVGALVEREGGELEDVSSEGNLVIAPEPESGLYSPGHCSLVRGVDGPPLLMLHARFGAHTAPRQMCLVRLNWLPDGRPAAVPPGGA
ncbi:MAG: family 43 glycosylhydrolase, partial [Rudaea sp.]